MSNSQSDKKAVKTLADYREKSKMTPWKLPLGTDETLVVQPPKGKVLMDLEEGKVVSTRDVIYAMAGEDETADRLIEVLENEDWSVWEAINEDMQKHFGLDKMAERLERSRRSGEYH